MASDPYNQMSQPPILGDRNSPNDIVSRYQIALNNILIMPAQLAVPLPSKSLVIISIPTRGKKFLKG